MADLKPCPFCNSNDIQLSGDGDLVWVSCNKCDADGPVMESDARAVAMWNERQSTIDHQAVSTIKFGSMVRTPYGRAMFVGSRGHTAAVVHENGTFIDVCELADITAWDDNFAD